MPIPERVHELIHWCADWDRLNGGTPEWQHLEDDEAWLEDCNAVELGDALAETERIIRAARAVKSHIEDYLTEDIATNGAIRLGNDGYYVGSATKRRVIDPAGLLTWLGTPDRISKAVRIDSSNVRIGVIRGFAGDQEDAVIDSFFEETTEDTTLRKVPESKAKWVQGLEHGGRR